MSNKFSHIEVYVLFFPLSNSTLYKKTNFSFYIKPYIKFGINSPCNFLFRITDPSFSLTFRRQYNILVRCTGSRFRQTKILVLCHLLIVRPWASCLTLPSLSVFSYKSGIIIVSTSYSYYNIK